MLSKVAFPQTLHSLSNVWLQAFMVSNNPITRVHLSWVPHSSPLVPGHCTVYSMIAAQVDRRWCIPFIHVLGGGARHSSMTVSEVGTLGCKMPHALKGH